MYDTPLDVRDNEEEVSKALANFVTRQQPPHPQSPPSLSTFLFTGRATRTNSPRESTRGSGPHHQPRAPREPDGRRISSECHPLSQVLPGRGRRARAFHDLRHRRESPGPAGPRHHQGAVPLVRGLAQVVRVHPRGALRAAHVAMQLLQVTEPLLERIYTSTDSVVECVYAHTVKRVLSLILSRQFGGTTLFPGPKLYHKPSTST